MLDTDRGPVELIWKLWEWEVGSGKWEVGSGKWGREGGREGESICKRAL